MVADVADEEVAGGVELEAVRLLECGVLRRAAVTGVTRLARAGEGRDDAGLQVHLAHRVVAHVHDVEVARAVETNLVREVERGLQRGPAVAGVALLAAARDGVNLAVRRDLAHALAGVFAEPDVTVRPAHDAEGIVDLRRLGRPAIARETSETVAGEG